MVRLPEKLTAQPLHPSSQNLLPPRQQINAILYQIDPSQSYTFKLVAELI
jgi:hypothetical protein